MNIKLGLQLSLLIIPGSLFAKGNTDVSVMTQNQYLGASLMPIIMASDPVVLNDALLTTLTRVQQNKTSERITALAESIAEKRPHFVGLQEVEQIICEPVFPNSGACELFAGAFNDHLQLTIDALSLAGADYKAVASVDNLSIDEIPVFIDRDLIPDIKISIRDRDVILVRSDVQNAQPAKLNCIWISSDGCNYTNFSIVFGQPILRGLVGVDAKINGNNYRFVNTHLEVPIALTAKGIPVQALQTSELLIALSGTPEDTRIIVAGDFNSSPDDVYPNNPYAQMIDGGFVDAWKRRPGKPSGYTCCQDSDLSNVESVHDTRIDLVFASHNPGRVKANVLDNSPDDKTISNLWPSDHSAVSVRLMYESRKPKIYDIISPPSTLMVWPVM